jgi:hypothetical protein
MQYNKILLRKIRFVVKCQGLRQVNNTSSSYMLDVLMITSSSERALLINLLTITLIKSLEKYI